jgi:type II secretory pathway predicted ATPase ExeA
LNRLGCVDEEWLIVFGLERSTIKVWMSHWGLSRDPFAESDSPYVSLPSHDEAVARLVLMIETSQRRVTLAGSAGLGKSVVWRQAFFASRSPRRRFASIVCPPNGELLFTSLAACIGQTVGRESSRLSSWLALERGLRLASLEGSQIVLAIEDCADRIDATARRDLESLVRLGSAVNADLTILLVEQNVEGAISEVGDAWSRPICLERLTRSQAEQFLVTKLEKAGNSDGIFTPRAITRLHALSVGVPRKLEQLANLCLIDGATRGLEVIHQDLVDASVQGRPSEALVSSP